MIKGNQVNFSCARHILASLMVLGFVSFLAACTSSAPEGKPMPELTFQHVKPLPVKAASLDIENNYDPATDPRDVSSSFPTPPDIALRRYAENRIQPAGEQGTLKFVIEDVHIYHSLVQPGGKLTTWMGMNRKDLYEVDMKIRMFMVDSEGKEGTHSVLNMRRSIAIPHGYSVSEKEHEKFKFLEMLMDDVDSAVTKTLAEKMRLSGQLKSVPVASLLSTPEIR